MAHKVDFQSRMFQTQAFDTSTNPQEGLAAGVYMDQRAEGGRTDELEESLEGYAGKLSFNVQRDTAASVKAAIQAVFPKLHDGHFGLAMRKRIERGSVDFSALSARGPEDTRSWVVIEGDTKLYDTNQPGSWKKPLEYSFRIFPLCKTAANVRACMVCQSLMNIQPIVL